MGDIPDPPLVQTVSMTATSAKLALALSRGTKQALTPDADNMYCNVPGCATTDSVMS